MPRLHLRLTTPTSRMKNIRQEVLKTHQSLFGKPSTITCAPGRVNILGEHIDYNGGQSYTFCLDRYIYIVGNKNQDRGLRLYSHTYRRYTEWQERLPKEKWSTFIQESVKLWEKKYSPLHLDLTIGSDLPSGAGISSSSALVCGLLSFFAETQKRTLTPDELIAMASEVEYGAGLQGGLMDQTTIVKGVQGSILHLDFAMKSTSSVKINPDYNWTLVDSQIEHSLVDSEYNTRKKECQKALSIINDSSGSSHTFLAHISEEDLSYLEDYPELLSRAQFVYNEMQRVKKLSALLGNHNPEKVGALLSETHEGLSTKYKVSTPVVDELVQSLNASSSVYGSRMMGGGFGGSILLLTKPDAEAEIQPIIEHYNNRHDKSTRLIYAHPVSGLKNESLY